MPDPVPVSLTHASILIDTTIDDDRWSPLITQLIDDFSAIAHAALSQTKWGKLFHNKIIFVGVLFSDDSHLQALNAEYRQKDVPTNVLSFPAFDVKTLLSGEIPFTDHEPIPLGDIVLSFDMLHKEVLDKGIPFHHHALHLFIHGFLHLLGYDHMTDDEADVMEALETQLLAHLHIPNPYGDH